MPGERQGPVNRDPVFRREVARDYPVVARAEGAYVYDTAGRRYLDGAGGIFVVNIGHGVREVVQAMAAQAGRVAFAHTTVFTSDAELAFARKLVDLAPAGFAKAWICTSGSAANETALKLAREYQLIKGQPTRTKIIARWNSYHGSSLGALSMTGQPRRREPYLPYMQDFPHIEPPYCYRCPFERTYPSCEMACAHALEKAIQASGADTIAAFIVEPVSGGPLGAVIPPKEYFPIIREICDRHGILMIVDEVITGVGRIGRNFGIDHWGVVPDIITAAKGIGGGYVPVGAMLVHERVYAAFEESGRAFRHGETFTGHAVISAAGAAVLDYVRDHGLIARAAATGRLLGDKLQRLRDIPIVGDIRGEGLLWGIELVRDKATREPFARERGVAEKVAKVAFETGLLVVAGTGCVDGVRGDTISLSPPLILTEAQVTELVDTLETALRTVAVVEMAVARA
jgi:adenosylmethionine-8-amino-7-oxononanoate aminotransferase